MNFELKKYPEHWMKLFEVSNAWAQYYEPGDIDTLVELGFDRDDVQLKIERTGWSDDYWFPIPESTDFGSFMFEHRAARFETASGKTSNGYVVNRGHCICLFGSRQEWSININLLDLLQEELAELKSDIGLSENEQLLPIQVNVPVKKMSFAFGEDYCI